MASSALLPYTYHPLPANAQTRIIELFPSPPGSEAETPLRCRLRDFNVYGDMDCEDYEAVSYAWGEPRFTEQLIVDDDYFLMTTVNFRDALRRFQLPDRPRLLWIDAVCINQQDEEDKGRQIPFMSQVYSGACGVLVWLGNYPEQAESLRQVERLGRQMQMLNGQGRNEQRLLSGSEADVSVLAAAASHILQDLLGIPWFNRLWVIQEVVLNPDVMLYCGSAHLSWTRFAQVVSSIKNHPSWSVLPSTVCSLWILKAFNGDATPRFNLVRLLQDLSSAKCSDDRDRIWAMSALATDLDIEVPAGVDFRENQMLPGQPGMDREPNPDERIRLSIDYNGLLLTDGLPSWAPDWRLPILRNPLISNEDSGKSQYAGVELKMVLEDNYAPGWQCQIPQSYRYRPLHCKCEFRGPVELLQLGCVDQSWIYFLIRNSGLLTLSGSIVEHMKETMTAVSRLWAKACYRTYSPQFLKFLVTKPKNFCRGSKDYQKDQKRITSKPWTTF
ncbi:hypothetical protein PG990_012272 [Apiospora arundinis]